MTTAHKKQKSGGSHGHPTSKARRQRQDPEEEEEQQQQQQELMAKDDEYTSTTSSTHDAPHPSEDEESEEDEPEPMVLGSKRKRDADQEASGAKRPDHELASMSRLMDSQFDVFHHVLTERFGIKDEHFPEKPPGWARRVIEAYANHLGIAALSPKALIEKTHIDTTYAFGCLAPNSIERWTLEFDRPQSKHADCSSTVIYEKRGPFARKAASSSSSTKKKDFSIDSIILPPMVAAGFKLDGLGFVSDHEAVQNGLNHSIEKNKYHLRLDIESAEREGHNPEHIVLGEFATIMLKRLNRHLLRKAFMSTQTQMLKKRTMLEELLDNESFRQEKGIVRGVEAVNADGKKVRREMDKFFDSDGKLITSHTHKAVFETLLNKWEISVDTAPWDEIVTNEETGGKSHYTRTWRDEDRTSATLKKRVFRELSEEEKPKDVVIQSHGGVTYPETEWKKEDANPFFAITELAARGFEWQRVNFVNVEKRDLLTANDLLEGPARFENVKPMIGKGSIIMVRVFLRYSSTTSNKHAMKMQFMNPVTVIKQRDERSTFDDSFTVVGDAITQACAPGHKANLEHNEIVVE